MVSELFKENHLQCLSQSRPSSLILAVYVVYFPFLNARNDSLGSSWGFFKAAYVCEDGLPGCLLLSSWTPGCMNSTSEGNKSRS